MRYVSEVYDTNGISVGFGITGRCDIIVSGDSDEGECLGLYEDVVVKYTKKAAILTRYIKRIFTIWVPGSATSMIMSDIGDDCIHIMGFNGKLSAYGGVVTLQNTKGVPSYHTVYDILCWLCKVYSKCLMSKHYLVIDDSSAMRTIIEFDQSDESKRFLTKMFVCGG